ncbi:MAG: hypothetical protein WAM60_23150 [Candidatus Promineifilaceae bacterium]
MAWNSNPGALSIQPALSGSTELAEVPSEVTVTLKLTDEWMVQELREATLQDNRPKNPIRNDDDKFGTKFSAVAKSTGIEKYHPFQVPKANVYRERLSGIMKLECIGKNNVIARPMLNSMP